MIIQVGSILKRPTLVPILSHKPFWISTKVSIDWVIVLALISEEEGKSRWSHGGVGNDWPMVGNQSWESLLLVLHPI